MSIISPVFEIALVRLSETSDYLHGQVNNPSSVIRWTSETLQPSADFPSNAFEVDTNLGHHEWLTLQALKEQAVSIYYVMLPK